MAPSEVTVFIDSHEICVYFKYCVEKVGQSMAEDILCCLLLWRRFPNCMVTADQIRQRDRSLYTLPGSSFDSESSNQV